MIDGRSAPSDDALAATLKRWKGPSHPPELAMWVGGAQLGGCPRDVGSRK